MKTVLLHLPFLCGLLVAPSLSAQDRPQVEFGRLSPEDRALTVAPGDSTTDAYVLYKSMHLDFEYNEQDGPSLTERYHRRVKLLKPSAFDEADVVLEYDRAYSSISEIEAFIHLPGGGSLPVPASAIVEEKQGDTDVSLKFTFPRVEVGAVIEYRYLYRKKSILIPSAYFFQEDIPVRWAQFTAMIPPYYRYITLGATRMDVDETKLTNRAWGPRFNTAAYNSGQQKIQHGDILWAMRDLAALREQPYSNNAVDYVPQVRLQLQEVEYPTGGVRSIFGDWQETVEELQSRDDFGRYYRNKSNYNQLWKSAEPVLAAAATDREKMEAAYAYVTRNFRWNGRYGMLASAPPDRIFADRGEGNSADLNMALLALLNEAGVPAHPLLVSLRNSGAPIEAYPLLYQFNHLMVYLELDGQPVFLDANEAERPAGLPRSRALNHRGWVADKQHPRWVNLEVPSSRQTVVAEMTIGADGATTAHLQSRMENYFAFDARSALASGDRSEAPLVPDLLRRFPELRVVSFREVESEVVIPARFDYELDVELAAAQPVNDFLYVQPVVLPLLDGHLADVETRTLPIDFPYPWMQRYIATVHLPEGYVLEEAPSPVRLRAEDGSMVASYSVSETVPGTLQVIYNVQLERTLYAAVEYPALRDLYRRIIELQETPLVLKRAK